MIATDREDFYFFKSGYGEVYSMKYHELSAGQLAETDRDSSIVVIPIAAVEQHGPHMPTGTDTILCTAVAEALESKLPEEVILTPTHWCGASAHHLPFGSTFDSPLLDFEMTLIDLGTSVLNDGFKRLLFLNGHGGNIDPMRVALRSLQSLYPDALLSGACYWDVIDLPSLGILEGDHQFVGHACEFETSMMLHIRPDLVDLSKATDAGALGEDQIEGIHLCRDMAQRTREGFTGRPDLATPEKGKALFEEIEKCLVKAVRGLLEFRVV